MAVPVVASFTSNGAGGTGATSVTLTKPTGVQNGDLLVLLVGNEESLNSPFPALTGWNQAYAFGSTTSDVQFTMYWRIADGTEGATQNVPWGAGALSDAGGGWYLRITGATTVNPIYLVGTNNDIGPATSNVVPSITITAINTLVISHLSFDGADATPFSSAGTGWPTTIPAGQELTDGPANTGWSGVWLTKNQPTTGASQNHTIGFSSSDGSSGVQVAIQGTVTFTVTANDSSHSHSVDGNLVLVEHKTVAIDDSSHGHTVDNVVLTQKHVLVVDDTVHDHTVDNIDLIEDDQLLVSDTFHDHTVDNIDLEQAHTLAIDDSLHGHTVDNIDLIENFQLTVDDSLHSHSVESPTLSENSTLIVDDSLHAHTAESPTPSETQVLVVDDSLHGHTAESPTLTQDHTLTVNDTVHDHTVESIVLFQEHLLSVDDTVHNHNVDNILLATDYFLSPNSTVHAHSAEEIDLEEAQSVVVDDSNHGHTADNIDLIEHFTLSVDDSSHSHTVENVDLIQAHSLSVSDSVHDHSVDNVDLEEKATLTVSDSFHDHLVDNITLSEDVQLATDSSLHAHLVDNIDLVENLTLIVNDSSHGHTVDSPVLAETEILTVNNTFHYHSVDTVVFDISAIKIVNLVERFETGDSVSVTIYDLSDNSIVVNSVAMGEIASTGHFKYKYEMLTAADVDFMYIMDNGSYIQSGKITFTNGNLIGVQTPLPLSEKEIEDIVTTIVDAAVVDIKGAEDRDLTEVYNNTPSIDPSSVWTYATRTLTASLDPTAAEIRQEMDNNSTELAAIKAKTDNLPADPAGVSDIPTEDEIADQVWDEDIADHLNAGSTGEALDDASSSGTSPADIWSYSTRELTAGTKDAEIDAIKAKTDNLPSDPADVSDIPTVIQIADQVWDELLAGHTVVGSTGKALDDAASGTGTTPADVWAYATRTLTAGTRDAEIDAIKAQTDLIPANPADVSDVPTAAQNADAVWDEPSADHELDLTMGDRIRRILYGSR